jgi:hypothetical protein
MYQRQYGSGTVFEREAPRRRRSIGELLLRGFVPPALLLILLLRAALSARPGRVVAGLLLAGIPLALITSRAPTADAPGTLAPGWWSGLARQRAALPFSGMFGPRQQPAPAAPAAAALSAGGGAGKAFVPLEDRLSVELLNGRPGRLRGIGLWVEPGTPVSRVLLERLPAEEAARATHQPSQAAAVVERLLAAEYRAVEVLSVAPATAWRLGPEEAGTSAAAGVTAPSDPVLGTGPVWVVTARGEGRPNREAIQVAGPLPAMLEVFILDVRTGDVLVRPPAMLFTDAEPLRFCCG